MRFRNGKNWAGKTRKHLVEVVQNQICTGQNRLYKYTVSSNLNPKLIKALFHVLLLYNVNTDFLEFDGNLQIKIQVTDGKQILLLTTVICIKQVGVKFPPPLCKFRFMNAWYL